MKKLFTPLLYAVFVSTAFPQGMVRFFNSSATLISCYDCVLVPIPSRPQATFYFALLCASEGTTDPAQFVFAGVYATNTTAAGIIQGGRLFGVTCNSNWPPGAVRSFMVAGWSADAGPTWDPSWLLNRPLISYYGMSTVATGRSGGVDPGGLLYPPLALFSTNAISSGFVLYGLAPPQLWISPSSQTVVAGSRVTFCALGSTFLTYQWYFNDIFVGATTACLTLTDVQPSQSGTYLVMAQCPAGAVVPTWMASATLTVGSAPVITVPPQTQTAIVGASCALTAGATGTLPLFYQWYFNSTNSVSGATNRSLRFPGLQFSDSGAYSVVVRNAFGAVTSAPAMLSIISAVEQRPVAAVNLSGTLGQSFNLEVTHTLEQGADWTPLDTVTLTNPGQFYLDAASLSGQRFYRAWQAPPVDTAPALAAHIIPAITLAGTAGSSVRIDYINQFGPTDAWVALATVTLTNTTQLYFDTSMIGQPPRFYRLVQVP